YKTPGSSADVIPARLQAERKPRRSKVMTDKSFCGDRFPSANYSRIRRDSPSAFESKRGHFSLLLMRLWRESHAHLRDLDPVKAGLDAGVGGGDGRSLGLVRGLDHQNAIHAPGVEHGPSEHKNALLKLALQVDKVLFHDLLLGVGHVLEEGG